ncbi:MAG: C4-type zinc ribbon domain-containing protein [Vicinamibacterales bacterium]
MSPELEHLVTLQSLDSSITDARARILLHPQRLADADARLTASQETVAAAKQRLKANHEARGALEKDAAVFQGRVTKFKDQLAAVKTNREFTAMQHEIETAQKALEVAEEKVIERMVEGDAIAADVKLAEAALARERKEVEAEKATLAEELVTLEAALAKASDARATLVTGLEPGLVKLVEQVARKRGVAICHATRDGLCSVCHVRLRPQVFQLVRANDAIIQCDTCNRILYYVPPPPPVEPPATHGTP